MAGDWIRMRSDMYRDPKVCAMAAMVCASLESRNDRNVTPVTCHVSRNVVRNAVVGALVTVWGVMRHRGHRDGDDLVVNGVPLAVLDDVADMPGLGQAMESVYWVESNEDSLVFPGFFGELNTEPTSTAKTPAQRQREFRERQKQQAKTVTDRNVTVTSRVTLRNAQREEREEREEEEIQTPLPPTTDTPPTGDPQPNGHGTSKQKKTRQRKPPMIPPTIEELREFSQAERINLNCDKFFNHYTGNGWMCGSNPMRDWRAKARDAASEWCKGPVSRVLQPEEYHTYNPYD